MTENELRRLKDLPIPPPSEEAKRAAVDAALVAFNPPLPKFTGEPQANAVPPRLRNTSSISEGNSKMRFRLPVAIAASIVVLALAVPFTLHLTRTHEATLHKDKVAAVSELQAPAPAALTSVQSQQCMWTGRATAPHTQKRERLAECATSLGSPRCRA